MAVLATPPFLAFYDNDGEPLSGGLIYTYAAGTTTPKATYTDESGTVEMPNPIVLDSAGRATWWLVGSYKYVVKDSLGNTIKTTDNVTSFNTLAEAVDPYFQSFSGNGSQTAFTVSEDLGTEEKGLYVWVDNGTPDITTNGGFVTDSDWAKGAGWTIGSGVATASGAISTAISQTSSTTLVEGTAYSVTYTITRSAGGLIPSIGGQNGTERTASGTYREIIIAGSSQTIAFTGNAFTGTLDNVIITLANGKGYEYQNPSSYTISGTTLTFATAPKTGTNNIYVSSPSLLVNAASASAAAAEASATAALASEVAAAASAISAQAYAQTNKFEYDTTTTMADPGTGKVRFNNATLASVTAIAISDLSDDSGNPDLSAWINTWGDDSGGSLLLRKDADDFVRYTVTAATNNSGWTELAVTYVNDGGTLVNTDELYIGFVKSGVTTVTGGITALTGDVTASGSGSVAATIANNAVTTAKIADSNVTLAKIADASASSKLLGSGDSGSGSPYEEITLGTGLSMSGTTLSASSGGWLSDTYSFDYWYDNFVGSAITGYEAAVSGTGAATNISTSVGAQLTTGTTATGRSAIARTATLTSPITGVKSGLLDSAEIEMLFQVQSLSTSGQRFTSRLGVSSDYTFASDPTNGIYFRYVDNVNSGNWQCVCRASGTESVINTAVPPVAATWQHFKFVANTTSEIEFFINNVSLGTITTNIPTAADMVNAVGTVKSVGTTNTFTYCRMMKGKVARV